MAAEHLRLVGNSSGAAISTIGILSLLVVRNVFVMVLSSLPPSRSRDAVEGRPQSLVQFRLFLSGAPPTTSKWHCIVLFESFPRHLQTTGSKLLAVIQ